MPNVTVAIRKRRPAQASAISNRPLVSSNDGSFGVMRNAQHIQADIDKAGGEVLHRADQIFSGRNQEQKEQHRKPDLANDPGAEQGDDGGLYQADHGILPDFVYRGQFAKPPQGKKRQNQQKDARLDTPALFS